MSTSQFSLVVEMERVRRWQEEPVEGQHARDRDRQGERKAPHDRGEQDGKDVQRPEAEHGDPAVEQPDCCGDEGDRTCAAEYSDCDVGFRARAGGSPGHRSEASQSSGRRPGAGVLLPLRLDPVDVAVQRQHVRLVVPVDAEGAR